MIYHDDRNAHGKNIWAYSHREGPLVKIERFPSREDAEARERGEQTFAERQNNVSEKRYA